MMGDWMGSNYGSSGKRYDIQFRIDPNGRYLWAVRCENDQERSETGRWTTEQNDAVLKLQPDSVADRPRLWRVLTVSTCEDANTLLVLREVAFESRNLPILFYRVHLLEKPDALQPLSDRDRDLFLDLLDNPPEPNAAFRKAAEAYRERHGEVE